MSFHEELTDLINKYSIENESDTPDFILADYLVCCLTTYRTTVKGRDMWYSYDPWKDDKIEDIPQKPVPPDVVMICEGCGLESNKCRCRMFYSGIAIIVGIALICVLMIMLAK